VARETFSIADGRYWALFRVHAGRVTLKENHVWRAPDSGTEHTNGRPFTGTAAAIDWTSCRTLHKNVILVDALAGETSLKIV
jgi:hypothetical protein